MSADMGYLRAFEDAQKKRLSAGEVAPSHRAGADIATREGIARTASARDDRAQKKTESGVANMSQQKPTNAQAYGGGEGVAGGMLSGAATGASIGGPYGAIAGAALGGLSAASKQKKAEFAAKKAGMSNAIGTYLQLIDSGMV